MQLHVSYEKAERCSVDDLSYMSWVDATHWLVDIEQGQTRGEIR